MKKITCISFLPVMVLVVSVCFFSVNAFAQSVNTLFLQANNFYENKEYRKALDVYESLVDDHGVVSADIYYNIANCYFKIDDLAYALLFYKRALLLNPRDSLIRENYAYARGFVALKDEDNRHALVRVLDRVLQPVSREELEVCVLVIIFVTLGSGVLMVLLGTLHERKKVFIVLLCVSFLAIFSWAFKMFVCGEHRDAIVMVNELPVRYGPTEHDTVAFYLSVGIEVAIVEESDAWVKVLLHSGKKGWTHRDAIAFVGEGA